MGDYCGPCKVRNTDTTASIYCITCQEPQCGLCNDVHRSSRATRAHLMVDIKDIDKDSKTDQDLEVFQKCVKHGKEVEFYCTNHNHLICGSCLIKTNGFECHSIVDIASAGEEIINSMFNDHIETDLDKVITCCLIENKRIRNKIQSSDNEHDDMRKFFRELKQNVQRMLDKYEKRILEEVEQNIETQLKGLNHQMDELTTTLKAAKEAEAKLKRVLNLSSKADIFRCCLSLTEQLDHLRVSKSMHKATVYTHSLKMSTALSFLIKDTYPVVKCDIQESSSEYPRFENIKATKEELLNIAQRLAVRKKMLGSNCSIDDAGEDERIKDDIALSKPLPNDEERQADDRKRSESYTEVHAGSWDDTKISHVSNIRVDSHDNRLITIHSVTTLIDGRLILSDKAASRLIVLKENFTYDHELLLKTPPGNLTVVTSSSMAVCFPTIKTVQIISTDANLILVSAFTTKYVPIGIHAIDKNRLFISMVDCKTSWYLNVLTPKGAVIVNVKSKHSILDAKHISSLKLAGHFRFYLVCCRRSNCLYCVQADGKEIYRYSITSPNGLYVDESNIIYIVESSGRLHQLSAKGELLQYCPIPTGANGISFYPAMNRLIVTRKTGSEMSVFIVKRGSQS